MFRFEMWKTHNAKQIKLEENLQTESIPLGTHHVFYLLILL